jgi:hypothetical protein
MPIPAEVSLRVAVIAFVLIIVFFFPAALVFIFFLIWLVSQKNIDSYQVVRRA